VLVLDRKVPENQMVHVVFPAPSLVWLTWVAMDVTYLDCCLPHSCCIIRYTCH
jgi:hypothetical protein